RPDDLLGRLAVLEQDHRRDRDDLELRGGLLVLVHVELRDAEVVALAGDLLEHRGDHAARAAPRGPEVHEDGVGGLDHLRLEVGVGDLEDVVCHACSFASGVVTSGSIVADPATACWSLGYPEHSHGARARDGTTGGAADLPSAGCRRSPTGRSRWPSTSSRTFTSSTGPSSTASSPTATRRRASARRRGPSPSWRRPVGPRSCRASA